MTQTSLFAWSETRPAAAPTASEQSREIVRVAKGIATHILTFCREHSEFTAEELRAYVVAKTGRAPGSPDRILRDLRQDGFIAYTADKRSRYTIHRVTG